jgi:hypothetical protein
MYSVNSKIAEQLWDVNIIGVGSSINRNLDGNLWVEWMPPCRGNLSHYFRKRKLEPITSMPNTIRIGKGLAYRRFLRCKRSENISDDFDASKPYSTIAHLYLIVLFPP